MIEYINIIMIVLIAIYTMIVHIAVIRLKFYTLKLLNEISKSEIKKYEEMAKAFNMVVKRINEKR